MLCGCSRGSAFTARPKYQTDLTSGKRRTYSLACVQVAISRLPNAWPGLGLAARLETAPVLKLQEEAAQHRFQGLLRMYYVPSDRFTSDLQEHPQAAAPRATTEQCNGTKTKAA